jgi:hypothetical protein
MSETTLPIKVKWLKNKYDVNVILDKPAGVLKAQVSTASTLCTRLRAAVVLVSRISVTLTKNSANRFFTMNCITKVSGKACELPTESTAISLLTSFWVGQLFELTGVLPERQKITAGAKQIKDDTDLRSIGLKANQV